jgi:hypothetical protein
MVRLIIAGVSQGLVTRHKGYRLPIDGWEVLFCHSRSFKSDLKTCWKEVLKLADESSHDGAHIIAFHSLAEERPEFEDTVYGRHRLVWPDQSRLADYGTTAFLDLVSSLVQFEEQWRAHVRPRNTTSPVILPESSFEAAHQLCDVWRRAHRVRLGHDRLMVVGDLMRRFRGEHYSKGCWVDTRARRFDPRGARHGLHCPAERRWKFTFEVPLGFHFDVTTGGGGAFSLRDAEGTVCTYTAYANVDCHGYVRGGR